MAVSLRFLAPVFCAAAVVAAAAGGLSGAPPRAAAYAADAVPAPPDVDVVSYVVADYDTGQILAERNPHRALYPASTLKVLTADTLLPRLAPTMSVTPKASDFAAEPDGSVVGMSAGVTYTVADLWRATFIDSANDAVAELAHLSGGLDRTVALMQAKARALGAYDTVVADADGYDADGQVTSAYDLAVLARAGLGRADFRAYCGLRQATFPGPGGKDIALKSHDPMLTGYAGMIGVKGGITTKAGHTYVGAATRGGHTVIETLMLGGTDIFDQAARLMDWGFAADGHVAGVGTLHGGAAVVPPTPTPTPAPTPTPTPTPTPMPTPTPTPASTHASASVSAAAASLPTTTSSAMVASPSQSPASPTPSEPPPSDPHPAVSVVAVSGPPPSDPLAAHAGWLASAAAAAACAIPLGTLIAGRRTPRRSKGSSRSSSE